MSGDTPESSPDAPRPVRQDRIAISLQLEVSGVDLGGREFVGEAQTKLVSRTGAAIVINRSLAPEQTITVKRVGAHPEAEMVVIGHIGRETSGNVYGVALVDPSVDIWGIDFPGDENDQAVVKLLLECPVCHTRQIVILHSFELNVLDSTRKLSRHCPKCNEMTWWRRSAYNIGTEPAPASIEVTSRNPNLVPVEKAPANRRKHSRLRVKMKGCILFAGQETPIEVEDMSRGGVRFCSQREFAAGLLVRAAIPYNPGAANIFVSAKICWSKPHPNDRWEYGLKYEALKYVKD